METERGKPWTAEVTKGTRPRGGKPLPNVLAKAASVGVRVADSVADGTVKVLDGILDAILVGTKPSHSNERTETKTAEAKREEPKPEKTPDEKAKAEHLQKILRELEEEENRYLWKGGRERGDGGRDRGRERERDR